jgi:hypothetical protein
MMLGNSAAILLLALTTTISYTPHPAPSCLALHPQTRPKINISPYFRSSFISKKITQARNTQLWCTTKVEEEKVKAKRWWWKGGRSSSRRGRSKGERGLKGEGVKEEGEQKGEDGHTPDNTQDHTQVHAHTFHAPQKNWASLLKVSNSSSQINTPFSFSPSLPRRLGPPANIYINGTNTKEFNGSVYLNAEDLTEILENYVSRELQNYVSRDSLSNYTATSTPPPQETSTSTPSPSFSYPRLIASPLTKIRDTRNMRASSNATNATTVAFPQPVDLTPSILTKSCMIMTALVMAVFLSSIAPNLWLVGGGVGALYGSEVADGYNKVQQLPLEEKKLAKPASVVGKIIVKMGKKVRTSTKAVKGRDYYAERPTNLR